MAGIPSILVCLHSGTELHVKSETSDAHHCEDTHSQAAAVVDCVTDIDCTDIELGGAEVIPTRVNETSFGVLDTSEFASFEYVIVAVGSIQMKSIRLPLSRAPPSVHWLTDTYLSNTVLRV